MSKSAGIYARKRSYRLQFHADCHGIAKVVEFFAADLSYAWELIKGDASHRDVDVWEDGMLVCHVSQSALDVRVGGPIMPPAAIEDLRRGGGCG